MARSLRLRVPDRERVTLGHADAQTGGLHLQIVVLDHDRQWGFRNVDKTYRLTASLKAKLHVGGAYTDLVGGIIRTDIEIRNLHAAWILTTIHADGKLPTPAAGAGQPNSAFGLGAGALQIDYDQSGHADALGSSYDESG
jgi:hypothetical protein